MLHESIFRRDPHKQHGAVALEFAIVISLLVLIVGGVVEFGRVFWYYNALTKTTRDGARYLSKSVDIATAKSLVVKEAAEAGLPGFGLGNVLVKCDPSLSSSCDDTEAAEHVTVGITGYSVNLGEWFPVVGGVVQLNLQPHTTMRYIGGGS